MCTEDFKVPPFALNAEKVWTSSISTHFIVSGSAILSRVAFMEELEFKQSSSFSFLIFFLLLTN